MHTLSEQELERFCIEDTRDKTLLIWIGHSTVLVNFQNTVLLTDPVFTELVSPVQYVGPKRFRPLPVTLDRLPCLHAVLLSHNHFDHINEATAAQLAAGKWPRLNWFVGQGDAEWLRALGVPAERLHELDWWQSVRFNELEFVFAPAQHWSGRSLSDKNKALWGSWVVKSDDKRMFFTGDTGYCTAFKEIGQKYGPFDLAFIPIGAYEPHWFLSPQHVDPEGAVKIHLDVGVKRSLGIHWGTFALAYEVSKCSLKLS